MLKWSLEHIQLKPSIKNNVRSIIWTDYSKENSGKNPKFSKTLISFFVFFAIEPKLNCVIDFQISSLSNQIEALDL